MTKLLTPIRLGRVELPNRVVMAPMTRSRASACGVPSDMAVEYYRQRASAGLIVTEGTQPSANGKGYCRTPGIYTAAQVAGWRKVVQAVHGSGGHLALQVMHCGRIGHPENKDPGTATVAPSAVPAKGTIYTESGMKPFVTPQALEREDIPGVIEEYRGATERAFDVGADLVELHCTSGYLPAQFLSTGTNLREDEYGGSLDNRLRFVVEVLAAMAGVDGADRVGIRICAGNPFNDLHDDDPEQTFTALLQRIDPMELAYLHVIRLPQGGVDNFALAQCCFSGARIINESFCFEEGEHAVGEGIGELVSFGRPYIANPDLVERFHRGAVLNDLDPTTIYAPGPEGYVDYPSLAEQG